MRQSRAKGYLHLKDLQLREEKEETTESNTDVAASVAPD